MKAGVVVMFVWGWQGPAMSDRSWEPSEAAVGSDAKEGRAGELEARDDADAASAPEHSIEAERMPQKGRAMFAFLEAEDHLAGRCFLGAEAPEDRPPIAVCGHPEYLYGAESGPNLGSQRVGGPA
jgi:hypothetical protein